VCDIRRLAAVDEAFCFYVFLFELCGGLFSLICSAGPISFYAKENRRKESVFVISPRLWKLRVMQKNRAAGVREGVKTRLALDKSPSENPYKGFQAWHFSVRNARRMGKILISSPFEIP